MIKVSAELVSSLNVLKFAQTRATELPARRASKIGDRQRHQVTKQPRSKLDIDPIGCVRKYERT